MHYAKRGLSRNVAFEYARDRLIGDILGRSDRGHHYERHGLTG